MTASADVRSPLASPFERSAILIFGACGVILTADALGLTLFREPVLSLPLGLWLIALVPLPVLLASRRGWQARTSPAGGAPAPIRLALSRAASRGYMTLRHLSSMLGLSPTALQTLEDALTRRMEALPWPVRPGNVLLDLPRPLADRLADRPARIPLRFITPAGPRSDLIDATVRLDSIGRAVLTPADPLPAGLSGSTPMDDWSPPARLSYPDLFPPSLYTPQARIIGLDLDLPRHLDALHVLIELFVVFRRDPSRLTLEDRLAGIFPFDSSVRARARREDELLLALVDVTRDPGCGGAHPLGDLAASLLSARLTSDECTLDVAERRRLMEEIAHGVPLDPILLLRLAALRAADLDDEGAIDAMVRADRLIRTGSWEPSRMDDAAYLQSEIEHAPDTAVGFGRISAGVGLLASTTPFSRLDFVREDVLDDLLHAPRFLGRDDDVAFIHRALRAIARAPGEDRLSDASTSPEPAIAA